MSVINADLEDTESLIRAALASRVWAVVGASRDPSRWGHRVFDDLQRGGYTVYPVNPNADEVLGVAAFPNLLALPERPDVAEFVTPPDVTERVLPECVALGVPIVWMQPGASSEAAVEFCRRNGIGVVDGACVMHERRYRAPHS